MDEIYRLAAAGENVTIPTHTMVRELMKGKNVKFEPKIIPEGSYFATIDAKDAAGLWKKLRLESHHGAPKKLQEWLGISDDIWDSSPAYLTGFLEHRGKQVGIHQALADELGFAHQGTRPAGLSNAQLVQKLRDAYSNIGLDDFGKIAADWLENQL
ncbi:hypothetical protein JIN78_14110 [Roseibacillus ishigakijimensis]|uniref:Uncharacterized protein n=2 Tax=Roseibacillus ishigakijimensis TaxID=454146 RepID=A0A934RW21_9BACT|nr:hypothetical protein [Roseibacillus ishigakijimensis]MBK1835200.1 hypothetical protein [Roseibacillus ishigakijimensis]